MKFLWVSNHPRAASGYGSQTRQVARRLLADGHEVEFSANDGSRGDTEWEGCLVRGSGLDRYSRDTVREDVLRSGADWVFVLYDPWVYTHQVQDPFTGMKNVTNWTPIDHTPISPALIPWLRDHSSIAMSQFGRDRLVELNASLVEDGNRPIPLDYIPHAVEPVFHPTPVSEGFGRPFRDVIGVPSSAFLVGIVAANTGGVHYDRKGWGDMLTAIAPVMARNEDVHLYLHTLPVGVEGINLPVLIRVAGIDTSRVHFADEYLMKKQSIRDEDMAAIYTSLDVLLLTSHGEGFGLPVLESLACGTPAIVSNSTAQPELVGEPWSPQRQGSFRTDCGWVVASQPDWNAKHGSWFSRPDIVHVSAALEDARRERGNKAMREAAVAKAAEYDADTVFDRYWRPHVRDLELQVKKLAEARDKRAAKAAKNLRAA